MVLRNACHSEVIWMARVQTKAEISPATAALVFILVLAMAGVSLWYFVIQQPFPKFSAPAISPSHMESPSSQAEPARAQDTQKPQTSHPASRP